ncbi:MAG: DUF3291 domain-containing protein [Henriciella sp.]
MKMHLAELNVGRLVAPKEDPRVKDFMDNLDLINGLGKRMPGFVWMMESSAAPQPGVPDAMVDGDPQLLPNLSIWEDVQSLEKFVWGTVHKKFYERRAEWFEVLDQMHFVMWWVPEGHEPTLEEALSKLEHRQIHGDTDEAFGWDWLKEAKMHRTHTCRAA